MQATRKKAPSPFTAPPAKAAAELGADKLRRGVGDDVDMGGAAGAAVAAREEKAKTRSRLLRGLKRAAGVTPSAESVMAVVNERQEVRAHTY